jgi:glucose/arabinose dehydrogenase
MLATGNRITAMAAAAALISLGLNGVAAPLQSDSPSPITLEPVVTSGLNAPDFVANAHDGSNRLFILEQPGRIAVLQPGGGAPSPLLDISTKVLYGGEQGLLGLAFHPQFAANRRFFVDYTRKPDGATVIAEYRVSVGDPNKADPEESVLLTIDQPFANHNGGMLAFGPDGFLYIGMGDGGSGNDPGNRAQNPQELLGKILRIDVDHTDPGKAYATPPDNPYRGMGTGRDEIFVLGLRNPWRFSFDRSTGQLYVGDVGQNLVEEIDIVTLGGNYGWRVFEGTRCTDLGPASCNPAAYVPPIAQYTHDNGRCSVTGGYVYRGTRASLPYGAYVFGDYCSGEIFMLSGGVQSVLLQGVPEIASFGEDEQGEIYVVGLGGSVHRIVNPDAPSKPTFYFPRFVSEEGGSADQNSYTGIAVTNYGGSTADLTFTAYDGAGSLIAGSGIVNPGSLSLPAGSQTALVDGQIFGQPIHFGNRVGWMKLGANSNQIAAFFLSFDSALTVLEGAEAVSTTPGYAVLSEIEAQGLTQVHVANPYPNPSSLTLRLVSPSGATLATAGRELAGNGALIESAASLFPGAGQNSSNYIQVVSSKGSVSFEFMSSAGADASGLNGQDATAGAKTLYAPQYVSGGGYRSTLSIVNLDPVAGNLDLRLFADDGAQIGGTRTVTVSGNGKVYVDDPAFFKDADGRVLQGCVQISSSRLHLAGSVVFSAVGRNGFSAALPLSAKFGRNLFFSQVASNDRYFTGIAVINPQSADATASVEVRGQDGSLIASDTFTIRAHGRKSALLTQYFPAFVGQDIHLGSIRMSSDSDLAAYVLFGTNDLTALSAISGTFPDN